MGQQLLLRDIEPRHYRSTNMTWEEAIERDLKEWHVPKQLYWGRRAWKFTCLNHEQDLDPPPTKISLLLSLLYIYFLYLFSPLCWWLMLCINSSLPLHGAKRLFVDYNDDDCRLYGQIWEMSLFYSGNWRLCHSWYKLKMVNNLSSTLKYYP